MPQPYIVWLSQINKELESLVGGKASNLGEMTRAGMPVPNGFVVTAEVYNAFLDATGLRVKINDLLQRTDVRDNKKLYETSQSIQQLIKKASLPDTLAKELAQNYHKLSGKDVYVAVRASAYTEGGILTALAGQQATYLNVIGAEQLVDALKAVWASIFEARAMLYRVEHDYSHFKVNMAVVVQRMVESEAAGIMFSLDPLTNDPSKVAIEAIWGLGEPVVSGEITPDHYEVDKQTWAIGRREVVRQEWQLARTTKAKAKQLGESNIHLPVSAGWQRKQKLDDEMIVKLAKLGVALEHYFGQPQDTEWAFAGGAVYLVETRPVTSAQIQPHDIPAAIEPQTSTASTPNTTPLLSGIPGSPGSATGPVKIVHDAKDLGKVKLGDILVAGAVTEEYAPTIRLAGGVVTNEGGVTSDAAVTSREFNIPAVVSTGNATHMLKNGETVTVDGTNGKVYAGEVVIASRLASTTPTGMPLPAAPANKTSMPVRTATKIYVNLSEPDLAEEIAHRHVDGVGLLRSEFMVAELGEHPKHLLNRGKEQALVDHLYNGILKFAKAFSPRPIIYRFSDFQSDEYSHLNGGVKLEEHEDNPALGYRGAFRFVHDPELLKIEIQAIKKVRQYHKNIWVMVPFVRTPQELAQIKQLMAEEGLYRGGSLKLFMLAEVPANVILLDQFIGVGIDGISIGTNDLTQLILGLDRDNPRMAVSFDERNEAVLWAVEQLVRGAAKHGIMCSVCGQAPSVYPEIARKLVEWGATSISVGPDSVQQTRQLVAEAEYDLVRLGRTMKSKG